MNIIYPYTNLDFPSQKASLIQSIHTCHALAETQKATVHFILKNPKRWSAQDILGYFGLGEHPDLFIHSVVIPYNSLPLLGRCLAILFKFNLYSKILSLIRTHPNSVVYARDINILSLLIRIKKLFGIKKLIYEAHSVQSLFLKNWHTWCSDTKPFPKWKSKWYASKENRVLKGVDSIVAVTQGLKETLKKESGIIENRISVVPDSTRLYPLETASPPELDSKKVVCYIGQLSPSRGVEVLIKAMKYLDSDSELQIIGGSDEGKDLERLKNLAKEVNLTDRIIFTGYVQPSRVAPYLLKSDVLVLPLLAHPHSTHFASSLKQFEYMASKRPIIATDLPSTREILRDKQNAILVKPNDPEALASGIKLVLENKELAEQIAENAYKEVCAEYTWQKRAEKILAIL
ncbi:MAG: glycosyltransferase [Candidatus Aminicenantes bacterium]|nr:glycosyltransferase [Candidatus Aminicenantes bacterium]